MKSHKSLLAKLLANEDINVEVASASTASFNPMTRTIRIPAWKDISNDTYDLLLGHEVGHALYTPTDGWHDAVHNYDFPKAYANIVEDIRIEKGIQKRYPGLRSNFINGYKELLERDFFGVDKVDVNTMSFMNRLNLKSKCRDLIDVNFSKEELVFVNKAYNCETFDDVIAVCDELHTWLKEKNEKAQEMNEPESEETCVAPAEDGDTDEVEEETTEGGDTNEVEETEEETESEEETETESEGGATEEETEDETNSIEAGEEIENDDSLDGDTEDSTDGGDSEILDPDFDYEDASTDDVFRENEETLATDDEGSLPKVINIPNYASVKPYIVSWKRAHELRVSKLNELKTTASMGAPVGSWQNPSTLRSVKKFIGEDDVYEAELKSALKNANENAEALVKEFERKKSAWQSQRAQESKKGSLNMSKLHNYKFSEDIFMSNVNMPNYKSHGLVSLIDFSGSMSANIATTITQAYILAVFAKKVGIKFNIMSFTTNNDKVLQGEMPEVKENTLDMSSLLLVEQFTDEMSKGHLVETFKTLWKTHQGYAMYACGSRCDRLGGTPLDTAMAALVPIIDNFKSKNQLQKVSLISITDGETHNSFATWAQPNTEMYYNNRHITTVTTRSYRDDADDNVIKRLSQFIGSFGVTTISFFIAARLKRIYNLPYEMTKDNKASQEFNKNGILQNKERYEDAYYYIKQTASIGEESYFDDITETSTRGDLNKALKTMGKDRVFARTFAKTLAEIIA